MKNLKKRYTGFTKIVRKGTDRLPISNVSIAEAYHVLVFSWKILEYAYSRRIWKFYSQNQSGTTQDVSSFAKVSSIILMNTHWEMDNKKSRWTCKKKFRIFMLMLLARIKFINVLPNMNIFILNVCSSSRKKLKVFHNLQERNYSVFSLCIAFQSVDI